MVDSQSDFLVIACILITSVRCSSVPDDSFENTLFQNVSKVSNGIIGVTQIKMLSPIIFLGWFLVLTTTRPSVSVLQHFWVYNRNP